MGDNEKYDVRTAWDMNLQEMKVIDAARLDAEQLRVQIRYDVRLAMAFVDELHIIRRVLLPLLEHKKLADILKQDTKDFEKELHDVDILARSEVNRANITYNKQFRIIGASGELIEKMDKLLDDMYRLKNAVGLGMHQKISRDMEGAIKRSAQ